MMGNGVHIVCERKVAKSAESIRAKLWENRGDRCGLEQRETVNGAASTPPLPTFTKPLGDTKDLTNAFVCDQTAGGGRSASQIRRFTFMLTQMKIDSMCWKMSRAQRADTELKLYSLMASAE